MKDSRAAPMVEPDRDFTGTLAAGMSLLSAFRVGDGSLAHRELVARTGLAKAKVSRLAFTLVALGFLRRDLPGGRYRLGSPVLSMGYPLLAGMRIRQIARPYMRAMADEVRGVVSMALRDRMQMICVESSRSDAAPARSPDIGTALPLLDSAMGWAWLLAAPTQESERAINQALVATGRKDAIEMQQMLRQAAREHAAQGYLAALGEGGQRSVAVALRASVDGDLLVFDCIVSPGRRSPRAIPALGKRLALMVRSVEEAMGLR